MRDGGSAGRAPTAPRGMTRGQVAAYLSLSPTSIDVWMRKGIIPGPIPGTSRWDRLAIDDAIDQASGRTQAPAAETAFDKWRRGREGPA